MTVLVAAMRGRAGLEEQPPEKQHAQEAEQAVQRFERENCEVSGESRISAGGYPSESHGYTLMSIYSVHGKVVPMKTIAAGEFKQTCLRLLDEVGVSGEPIVITKRGKAVAQLMPVTAAHQAEWAGALRDRGSIHGDLVAPAVEPDEWEALRG